MPPERALSLVILDAVERFDLALAAGAAATPCIACASAIASGGATGERAPSAGIVVHAVSVSELYVSVTVLYVTAATVHYTFATGLYVAAAAVH